MEESNSVSATERSPPNNPSPITGLDSNPKFQDLTPSDAAYIESFVMGEQERERISEWLTRKRVRVKVAWIRRIQFGVGASRYRTCQLRLLPSTHYITTTDL